MPQCHNSIFDQGVGQDILQRELVAMVYYLENTYLMSSILYKSDKSHSITIKEPLDLNSIVAQATKVWFKLKLHT